MLNRLFGIRSSSKKSSPPPKSPTKRVRPARPEKTEHHEYNLLKISINSDIRKYLEKYNEINDGKITDNVIGKQLVSKFNFNKQKWSNIKKLLDIEIDNLSKIDVKETDYNKYFAIKLLIRNLEHIYNILCNHFATFFSPCDSEYDLKEEVLPDIDISDDSPISKMKSPEPKTKRSEKSKSLPEDLEDKYNDFLKVLPRYKKDLKSYKEICINNLSYTTNPHEIRKYQSLLQVITIYDTSDSDLKGGRKIKSKKYTKKYR